MSRLMDWCRPVWNLRSGTRTPDRRSESAPFTNLTLRPSKRNTFSRYLVSLSPRHNLGLSWTVLCLSPWWNAIQYGSRPMKSWNLASSVFLFSQLTSFQIHTYFGFPFCDFCSNYLWGLTQQGFQCQDCGINVHHQCKDELPADCKPSKKRISKGMHIPRGQSLNSSQIL